MKYVVAVCSTHDNCITNEGVFDTLVSAKRELKKLELYYTGVWQNYVDVIPHGDPDDDTCFDLELCGEGYEIYGQILEVE